MILFMCLVMCGVHDTDAGAGFTWRVEKPCYTRIALLFKGRTPTLALKIA